MSTSTQKLQLSKRALFLKKDRERKKLSRKKVKVMASSNNKSAQEKIRKIQNQLHKRYKENKKLGKCKKYENSRRRKNLLNRIKQQIQIEKKPLNKSWIMWHNQKMTPLIAVIRQRDVKGVGVLLAMKASPCLC